MPHASPRLTELDWLRIAAFALLILYHCGMFYVPWEWHVKSPRLVPALEWVMAAINPWRMGLLFLISGAATGLMGPPGWRLAAGRSRRLMLPLLFGMAVVVPPQPYLEVVEKLGWGGSYGEFMRLYIQGYGGFCRGDDCLALPTWNHLWFLPYLWLYTLAALALGAGWRRSPIWAGLGRGARLLWLPWLLLAVLRITVMPHLPITHDLVHDGYAHLLYATLFVLGLALFGHPDDRHGAWAAAVRWRRWALGLAFAAQCVSWAAQWAYPGDTPIPDALLALLRANTAARQWLPVVALLGYARLHLAHRDGPWRRALTEAVFPCYIAHQTLTVVAGHLLAPLHWPLALEALTLVATTLLGSLLIWRLVRGVPVLATCMGVERRSEKTS